MSMIIDGTGGAAPVTMGSLFDGIGAAPLAASYYGIKTLWASEILSAAISVTKRHFPEMEHLGDVRNVDGGRITPVDIVVAGTLSFIYDKLPYQGKRVIRESTKIAETSVIFSINS